MAGGEAAFRILLTAPPSCVLAPEARVVEAFYFAVERFLVGPA
jgi:hypothetical protein